MEHPNHPKGNMRRLTSEEIEDIQAERHLLDGDLNVGHRANLHYRLSTKHVRSLLNHISALQKENEELREALKLVQSHFNDLYESNPGFMGKLFLQDYALWNKALLAMDTALSSNGGEK